jgi:putative ATP-binding cassette transporter
MRSLGSFLRDAWHLAKPYFNSEEKWSARLLLASVIGLNLFMVALDVVLNFWNGLFYDALQNKNWTAFIDLLFWYQFGPDGLMPGFCVIAVIYILVAVYRTYLNQWLEIRWRRWLTSKFMEKWLADRAYYQISLTADPNGVGTDNPDQRIAEDLRSFVNNTLTLGIDLLSNIVSLFSFVGILWTLSGAVQLLGISIPGYMVWVALIYAVLGSWLTHLVGRPLAALNFRQQRFEANFRFSLVRLRENTEGVALYGGERQENAAITQRFGAVVLNWWSIMQRTKLLNALIAGYQQVAIVFPLIVAAPRYFSGQIALGGLMRTASAFGQVQGAMSWLVGAYSSLASWRATVERLATFEGAIKAARTAAECGISAAPSSTTSLELDNVALNLPNGAPLIARQTLTIPPHQSVLISGQSGAGKSTLFRALAGIWPFGSGTVQLPPGKSLFLPQRPYLPLGTLRQAIAYPAPAAQFEDAAFVAALADAGLEKLVGRLDQEDNWSLRLSGGEQQRLAIARALLLRPDWLFLDEATASLDPEAEMQLYRVLKERLPGTGLISIAHRQALAAFHDRHLVLTPGGVGEGSVLAAAEGRAEAAPLQPIS